ncbi:hypothetical protein RclHR1_04430016 [Rhizophagus clarus]|uniref:Uncharacterized protein n=1 Tax=Rhizophagus clarus TaxID=94130 RepID=A0A2Z6RHF4_9GLOM|nr:hypothetical protein RclHR1_04430016 [Rhizophagus clarus]GES82733.1 hypothetical protein GLOIN_2v1472513 [Rhizophagus clarus]
MSSQGAISSLAFSSGAVVTAASMGYVFGRPTKSKKRRNSIQLSHTSMNNNNNSSSCDVSTPSTPSSTSSFSTTSISPKSPLKRFKLFSSKSKRSKVSSSSYIYQKTAPIAIPPDQITDDDNDDISSMYSEVTSVCTMNDRDRKTLSVPNLSSTQQHWDNSPSMSFTSGAFNPRSVPGIVEEEEEEEENWDAQSDSGYDEPLSKSAGKSTSTLPLSKPPPKRHTRCKSLPPINVQDYSPSLYHRQPTPSEVWDEDEDFDLENTNELNVPSLVEESQVSLRMDISNIRDFVSNIGELKVLRDEKEKLRSTIQSKISRKWTNGFLRTDSKKVKYLGNIFKQDWEEADVIIDIADVAQNNETTFSGGKRVEVDIERIPSERHLKIFKKIVIESLGDEAKNLELFDDDDSNDDDKENHCDFNISSKNTAKKQKLMSFCAKNNDINENSSENRRRSEDFKISVEVMPSLIDYLKKLQERLKIHVKELNKLAQNTV